MKTPNRPGAPARQRGAAAIELAAVLLCTFLLLPVMFLFARVLMCYSVMKGASGDASAYLASLPRAAMSEPAERLRHLAIARNIVADSALAAGMGDSTDILGTDFRCDDPLCDNGGALPRQLSTTVHFALIDDNFLYFTSPWTTDNTNKWEIGLTSVTAYAN